jgi:hypothetical protein
MPLIETVGSSSARGFGLNSGKGLYPQAFPNTISNLYAWYDGDSLNSGATSWSDKSGNGRTVTLSSGTKSKQTISGFGANKSVTGLLFDPSTNISWFPGLTFSNTSGYTFIHVAKYFDISDITIDNRIFHTSYGPNWLSGFWDGNSGTQYHMGWLEGVQGAHPINNHGNNWVISTDQHNLYRSNGTLRGNAGNTTYTASDGVKTNNSYETSKGYIAEVMWFTRNLSESEYKLIEGYLSNKYGIDLGF